MTVRTIVVGTDGSEAATVAVGWAAELAAALGARVVLVHAFDPLALLGKVGPPFDVPALAASARERLAGAWSAPLVDAGVDHVTLLAEDTPADALLRAASEHGADLVVVGARGLSAVRGALLGSTSRMVSHDGRWPVCIVPLRSVRGTASR